VFGNRRLLSAAVTLEMRATVGCWKVSHQEEKSKTLSTKEGYMTRILVCALCVALLAAPVAFSQQPQGQNPPPSTPPVTYPDNRSQSQPSPSPTQESTQDKASVNSQMQSDLKGVLSSDPALSGTDVQASVDDMNITLTGSVQSQAQVERVMALVSPYARYRNVVNKMTVK
jgi:BON domain